MEVILAMVKMKAFIYGKLGVAFMLTVMGLLLGGRQLSWPRNPFRRHPDRLRSPLNLPKQSNVMPSVQPCPQKHSASLLPQITSLSPAVPAQQGGVS